MRPRRRRLARLRRAGRPAPSASLRRLARAFARSRPSLFRLGGVDLPIHPGNVDPNTCGVLWLADMEPS